MPRTGRTLDRSQVTDDTPLRLDQAVDIFFYEGSGITVSSLRREHKRGRLQVFTIAGKQFTTLAYLRQMMEACQEVPKTGGPAPSPYAATPPAAPPAGSSETAPRCTPQDALQAKLQALTRPSPTSSKRTRQQ